MRVNFGFRVSACTSKDKSESRFRVLVCGFSGFGLRVRRQVWELVSAFGFRASKPVLRSSLRIMSPLPCLRRSRYGDTNLRPDVSEDSGCRAREHEKRASENGVSDRYTPAIYGHSDRETWQKWTNEPLESLGFSKDSFGSSLPGLAEKERPEMRVAMDSQHLTLGMFWIPVLRGEYYCRYWFVLLLCCMDHSWRRDGTYRNWRWVFLAYGIAKNELFLVSDHPIFMLDLPRRPFQHSPLVVSFLDQWFLVPLEWTSWFWDEPRHRNIEGSPLEIHRWLCFSQLFSLWFCQTVDHFAEISLDICSFNPPFFDHFIPAIRRRASAPRGSSALRWPGRPIWTSAWTCIPPLIESSGVGRGTGSW